MHSCCYAHMHINIVPEANNFRINYTILYKRNIEVDLDETVFTPSRYLLLHLIFIKNPIKYIIDRHKFLNLFEDAHLSVKIRSYHIILWRVLKLEKILNIVCKTLFEKRECFDMAPFGFSIFWKFYQQFWTELTSSLYYVRFLLTKHFNISKIYCEKFAPLNVL